MAKTFIYEVSETKKYLPCTVTSISFGKSDDGIKKAAVHVKDVENTEWTVWFSNKKEPDATQMVDRIEKAKLAAGSTILVGGYFDLEKKVANGFDFRYSCFARVKQEEDQELFVYFGKVMSPKFRPATEQYKANQFILSAPVTDRNKNTKWCNMEFSNKGRALKGDWMKERYEKAIAPGKIGELDETGKPKRFVQTAAILCGRIRENTGKDGRVYYNVHAFDMILMNKNTNAISDEFKEEYDDLSDI